MSVVPHLRPTLVKITAVVAEQPDPTSRPIVPGQAPLSGSAPVPARAARTEMLARARTALARVVPQSQYQLARIGPAGQMGLAALVAAAVIAVSVLIPARNAIHTLSADIAQAQHQAHTAGTLQGIPGFVAALPTRSQIPAVLGVVVEQASKAGVTLDNGHYEFSPAKAGGVARYELEFPVKASYPNIRDFINRTLTAVPAAGLDKLHVERKAVGDTVVSADVRFVIFVRGE